MNLKCDIPVSKSAFKWVNLCRYSEGYTDSLQDAADFLDSAYNDANPVNVLLVNISPQLLRRPELYALFGDNVVEFEAQWEWPRTVVGLYTLESSRPIARKRMVSILEPIN